MATPYTEVYTRFLGKVTDYFIFDLSDEETCDYCYGLLMSALSDLADIEHNLTDVDDTEGQFNETLSTTEIEYIAYQMVCEWVSPQLNNTTLTRQYIGTKDEKFYAPSNLIAQLRNLRDDALARRKKIRRDWNYRNSSYLDS